MLSQTRIWLGEVLVYNVYVFVYVCAIWLGEVLVYNVYVFVYVCAIRLGEKLHMLENFLRMYICMGLCSVSIVHVFEMP